MPERAFAKRCAIFLKFDSFFGEESLKFFSLYAIIKKNFDPKEVLTGKRAMTLKPKRRAGPFLTGDERYRCIALFFHL